MEASGHMSLCWRTTSSTSSRASRCRLPSRGRPAAVYSSPRRCSSTQIRWSWSMRLVTSQRTLSDSSAMRFLSVRGMGYRLRACRWEGEVRGAAAPARRSACARMSLSVCRLVLTGPLRPDRSGASKRFQSRPRVRADNRSIRSATRGASSRRYSNRTTPPPTCWLAWGMPSRSRFMAMICPSPSQGTVWKSRRPLDSAPFSNGAASAAPGSGCASGSVREAFGSMVSMRATGVSVQ